MNRHLFVRLLSLLLLLLLIVNLGCGTTKSLVKNTKSLVKKIKPAKPYLKKKIMVFPPIDHSGLPSGSTGQLNVYLVDHLKESPHLLIYEPPKDLNLPSELKSPKFGVAYYHPDIAVMTKNMDMNALIAAFFLPIKTTNGRDGIWPFRYSTDIHEISLVLNVFNTMNGCLYLTNFDSEEIVFPTDEEKNLKEKGLLEQVMTKAIPDLLERQAATVIEKLVEASWAGRILGISNGVLKINAGKEVGVQPDQRFTVFEQGESIECRTGRIVDLLGKKAGTIKVVTVMPGYSLAAPDEGGPFSAGQTIIFIPE